MPGMSYQSLRAAIEKQARREARDIQAAAPPDAPGPPASSAASADLPDDTAINAASALLKRFGIRLIQLGAEMHVGIWGWLDCEAVRDALKVMGNDGAPVLYLDDQTLDLPDRFRVCTCDRELDSEPLPAEVIRAMKQAARDPWAVRDELLDEMGWRYWTAGRPGARTVDEERERAADHVVDRAVDVDEASGEGTAEITTAGALVRTAADRDAGPLSASEIRWRRDNARRVFERARAERPEASLRLTEQERRQREGFEREQSCLREGWNRWLAWRVRAPEAADAWRAERQAADGDDRMWMIELAITPSPVKRAGKEKRAAAKDANQKLVS